MGEGSAWHTLLHTLVDQMTEDDARMEVVRLGSPKPAAPDATAPATLAVVRTTKTRASRKGNGYPVSDAIDALPNRRGPSIAIVNWLRAKGWGRIASDDADACRIIERSMRKQSGRLKQWPEDGTWSRVDWEPTTGTDG